MLKNGLAGYGLVVIGILCAATSCSTPDGDEPWSSKSEYDFLPQLPGRFEYGAPAFETDIEERGVDVTVVPPDVGLRASLATLCIIAPTAPQADFDERCQELKDDTSSTDGRQFYGSKLATRPGLEEFELRIACWDAGCLQDAQRFAGLWNTEG